MFSTMFGALQRWQEDAFDQLQAGGDESFIAGGRVVFAGAVHSPALLSGSARVRKVGRNPVGVGRNGLAEYPR